MGWTWLLALALVPAGAAEKKVLFLGNSYTYVNDLPTTLRALAASGGEKLRTAQWTSGGLRLKDHASSSESLRRLDTPWWDAIVLQEQSQLPAFDDAQVERDVFPYAEALAARGRAANPKARLVFYETWGRRDGDAENCRAIPAVCAYEGQQARLTRTYRRLAARLRGVVAPVGEAWQRVRRERPEVSLYDGDGSHPSVEGTYLAACVFYAVLYGKPPVGLSPLSLPKERAALLQRYASEAVLGASRRARPI